MTCPFCGNEEQIVLNTRKTHKNTSTWRRRRCTKCFKIFTTYENIQLDYIKVIKKSGEKVRFNRSKLFSSIYHSTYNIKNFDNGDSAILSEKVTQDIEKYLVTNHIQEISTKDLFDIVLNILKDINYTVAINYLNYFKKPKGSRELTKDLR